MPQILFHSVVLMYLQKCLTMLTCPLSLATFAFIARIIVLPILCGFVCMQNRISRIGFLFLFDMPISLGVL